MDQSKEVKTVDEASQLDGFELFELNPIGAESNTDGRDESGFDAKNIVTSNRQGSNVARGDLRELSSRSRAILNGNFEEIDALNSLWDIP